MRLNMFRRSASLPLPTRRSRSRSRSKRQCSSRRMKVSQHFACPIDSACFGYAAGMRRIVHWCFGWLPGGPKSNGC